MSKFTILSATLVFTLFVNFLANYLPLNGISTANVSMLYTNYFTPANYVFSIWGIIYGALILMYFAVGFDLKKFGKYLEKVFNWYVIVNMANIAWLFAWHYQMLPLTVPFMVLILICLSQIYLITQKEKALTPIFKFSSSVYLGWISVATIANISAFFVGMGYTSLFLPESYMAVIMMLIALGLGLTMLKLYKDYVFFGVILWAIVGIIVKFSAVPQIFIGGIVLLACAIAGVLFVLPKAKRGKK